MEFSNTITKPSIKSSSKPSIPSSEYPQRWKKVQQMMAEENLDFVVAYANDQATYGAAHARWLANFPVHFEPVCILVPKEGDPIMLVGPESDEYALVVGEIKDVRVLKEFIHPDEDYPHSEMQSLAEILSETGWEISSIKRIGLGAGDLIGANLMQSFKNAIPNAKWVNVETRLCNLRAIKTPAEIEVIKYAYQIAEAGFKAAVDKIAEGVTEREIAAEIESAMRRAGSEGTGIDTIVASGPNTRPILARSTFRKIEKNDMVLLTIAPRFEGYHAAIGRLVTVGNPGTEVKEALDTAIEAQKACHKALKAGIEGRKIEALGREIVAEKDLEKYFLYSGVHSVGVIEFEAPIFGPSCDSIVKKDMIISIDIPMFNTPWGGLRIENGYIITENGAEPLHNTPYYIEK